MSVPGSTDRPPQRSLPDRLLVEGLPVEHRRIEIAGVSTPMLIGGEGPPIVLLHGLGSFKEEWTLVIPELGRSRRVVVPDLPGLGRSKVGSGSLDAVSVTEWLRRTIEETCSEPPVLVGHS